MVQQSAAEREANNGHEQEVARAAARESVRYSEGCDAGTGTGMFTASAAAIYRKAAGVDANHRTERKEINMVTKGNKDGHNYNYGHVRGVRVQEMEKWGRSAAVRRYGELKQTDMKPKDMSQPQDRQDKPDTKNFNDVSENSWLRGGGRGGEGYQNFDDHRPRGAAPRSPKPERPSNPGTGDVHGWLRDGGGSPFSRAAKR